jgi:hypothetical protein
VVRTGGHQVHAVDLDADPVVGQAVDRRQARHAARAIQAHARDVQQQTGSVAGGGAHWCQRSLADGDFAGAEHPGLGHGDRSHRLVVLGQGGHGQGRTQGGDAIQSECHGAIAVSC